MTEARLLSKAARLALPFVITTSASASSFAHEELRDDPYALPDAFATPTLPDLTHRDLALGLDTTLASIQPSRLSESARPPRSLGILQRLEAEKALSIRRWYLGAAMGLVSGSDEPRIAISQPEVWGRAIWASRAGLAFGGGVGLVFPVFGYAESTRDSLIEGQVRVVRPWDFTSFNDDAFTFRPFVDVRAIDGPVLLQLRQGIDWAMPLEGGEPRISSRTSLYIGYSIADTVQLGLEGSEVYFIKAPAISDEERATYTLSPSIRYKTRMVEPGISAIFPLDQTILGVADSFWAVRLNVVFTLDGAG